MSWYYAVNGQVAGPVEDAELRGLVGAGIVTASTLVWRAGMEGWSAFGALAPAAAVPTHQCQHCRKGWTLEQLIPLQGGLICAECKPVVVQRIREGLAPGGAVKHFAGFWIRAVARMIDGTITSIVGYLFQIPLLVVAAGMGSTSATPNVGLLMGTMAIAIVLSLAAACYYEAWFLVKKGATPGKMIVGLKVIRARGGAMTWKLAVGRYFAYMLSGLLLNVGYMMAGWDEEKRSLHDRICDTRVVTGS